MKPRIVHMPCLMFNGDVFPIIRMPAAVRIAGAGIIHLTPARFEPDAEAVARELVNRTFSDIDAPTPTEKTMPAAFADFIAAFPAVIAEVVGAPHLLLLAGYGCGPAKQPQ